MAPFSPRLILRSTCSFGRGDIWIEGLSSASTHSSTHSTTRSHRAERTSVRKWLTSCLCHSFVSLHCQKRETSAAARHSLRRPSTPRPPIDPLYTPSRSPLGPL
eukprot:8481959-Pyramimonas_sp.AAC.1